jgi:crotonobetainyl-CoA:carnitine CoA-transferase CaiB-like acyl-CoA transferase
MGPFPGDIPHPEKSGLFLYLNTNKKGVTLNLKMTAGRDLLRRLVSEWADVVVENFHPHVLPSLGLGYESLSKLQPRLVMTSISNYGQTGPYRDFEAEDINIQALGGIIKLTGDPDKAPNKLGGYFAEYTGGMYAATGTAIARYYASTSGEGQHVDISLLEPLATGLGPSLTAYGYMGAVSNRQGGGQDGWWPWGLFEAADGHVAIGIRREWMQVVQMMEDVPELADPKYDVASVRSDDRQVLDDLVAPSLKAMTKREFYAKAQSFGAPVGYCATAEDVFSEPHLSKRGYLHVVEHPEAGTITMPGLPWQSSGPATRVTRSPLLGEHNREIYCDTLGLSNDELLTLVREGVL